MDSAAMNITLSNKSTDSKSNRPKKKRLQKRFDKLLQEIKTKQLENENLRDELSEMHKIYQDKILPIEQASAKPYSELTKRLIDFYRRKSLSKWQREELSLWIMENIEHISRFDTEICDELHQSFQQVFSDFHEISIEELEEQAKHAEEYFEEMFESGNKKSHSDKQNEESEKPNFQEDMFGFDGFENEESKNRKNGERVRFEDFFHDEYFDEPLSEKVTINDKWLKTVFHRTAKALHPDKEKDDKRKLEKEKLISQLMVAREENDVFTMLSLYTQYAKYDEADLLIADETMEGLCTQLSLQISQLEEENRSILYSNPVQASLYELLYSKSKKTRDKNINRHINDVKNSINELSSFVLSLRNLKILKTHLEDRYDEKRFSPFEYFEDEREFF